MNARLSYKEAAVLLQVLSEEFGEPNIGNVLEYIGINQFSPRRVICEELVAIAQRRIARGLPTAPRPSFYKSATWRALRYDALERCGATCQCCGRDPRRHNVVLHVDHIVARSICPERETDPTNLQVLCEDCNIGKSNRYSTDWANCSNSQGGAGANNPRVEAV